MWNRAGVWEAQRFGCHRVYSKSRTAALPPASCVKTESRRPPHHHTCFLDSESLSNLFNETTTRARRNSVAPCKSVVHNYRRFGGTCCLHPWGDS
jgi:hypothetical protein